MPRQPLSFQPRYCLCSSNLAEYAATEVSWRKRLISRSAVASKLGSPYRVVSASAKVSKEDNSLGGLALASPVFHLLTSGRHQLKAGPVSRAPAYSTFNLSVLN